MSAIRHHKLTTQGAAVPGLSIDEPVDEFHIVGVHGVVMVLH